MVVTRLKFNLFLLHGLGDYVYWTDSNSRSLERMNKNTGMERKYVIESRADVVKLIGVDLDNQPNGETQVQ